MKDIFSEVHACYKDRNKDPIEYARLIDRALREGTGLNELALKANVPVAGLSKYHRLLLLPEDIQERVSLGKLQFRVAREFVGKTLLNRPDFNALLKLFTTGQLKSHDIHRFTIAVRTHPHLAAPDYLDLILRNKGKGSEEPEDPVEPERAPVPASKTPGPKEVQQSTLHLMATLMSWSPDKTIDTMMAVQSLKKLKPYVDRAAAL